MQFLREFGKIVCCHPLGGLAPPPWGILDPPLIMYQSHIPVFLFPSDHFFTESCIDNFVKYSSTFLRQNIQPNFYSLHRVHEGTFPDCESNGMAACPFSHLLLQYSSTKTFIHRVHERTFPDWHGSLSLLPLTFRIFILLDPAWQPVPFTTYFYNLFILNPSLGSKREPSQTALRIEDAGRYSCRATSDVTSITQTSDMILTVECKLLNVCLNVTSLNVCLNGQK